MPEGVPVIVIIVVKLVVKNEDGEGLTVTRPGDRVSEAEPVEHKVPTEVTEDVELAV